MAGGGYDTVVVVLGVGMADEEDTMDRHGVAVVAWLLLSPDLLMMIRERERRAFSVG
jgi:hypothetical protein